jgi:hypothetical protein
MFPFFFRNFYFISEVHLGVGRCLASLFPPPAHAHANHNDVFNLRNMNFRLNFFKLLKHLSLRRASVFNFLSYGSNTEREVVEPFRQSYYQWYEAHILFGWLIRETDISARFIFFDIPSPSPL